MPIQIHQSQKDHSKISDIGSEKQECERWILLKLKRNLAGIRELFYVSGLGIFGSFVKGSQQDGSNIDVLVTFVKGHKEFFNYMRLQYYLEDLLKKKIDLVIKDAVKPRLKGKILVERCHRFQEYTNP